MIGRMIRAFGADDVATLTPAKFRKLRFLMIANSKPDYSRVYTWDERRIQDMSLNQQRSHQAAIPSDPCQAEPETSSRANRQSESRLRPSLSLHHPLPAGLGRSQGNLTMLWPPDRVLE